MNYRFLLPRSKFGPPRSVLPFEFSSSGGLWRLYYGEAQENVYFSVSMQPVPVLWLAWEKELFVLSLYLSFLLVKSSLWGRTLFCTNIYVLCFFILFSGTVEIYSPFYLKNTILSIISINGLKIQVMVRIYLCEVGHLLH